MYFTPAVTGFLNARLSSINAGEAAGGPPIEIISVENFDDVRSASVIQQGVDEDDLVSWDRNAEPSRAWLQTRGAVPVDSVQWQIGVVGRRTEAVAITRMRPVLQGSCSAPVGGALLENPGPIGGGTDATVLTTRIDSIERDFTFDGPDGRSPYFGARTITLPKDEKTFILIEATTSWPYCRWTVEMDYIADGKQQSTVLRPPGSDYFSITGRLRPEQYDTVFLAPDRECPTSYQQVSGPDYALLPARGEPGACGR